MPYEYEPDYTLWDRDDDENWRQIDCLRVPADFIELAQEASSPYRSRNEELRSLLLLSDLYVASPQFFARLQSLPDSFKLPERKPLVTQMVGNGVPVNLAAEVVSQTLALCS